MKVPTQRSPTGPQPIARDLTGPLASVTSRRSVLLGASAALALPVATATRSAAAELEPTAGRHTSGFVVVTDLGARGDGRSDDTAALQSAIDTGFPVLVPRGTYRITRPLDLRRDGLTFLGLDPDGTVIEQSTSNVPILLVGGQGLEIRGLHLRFATYQPRANTEAYAIKAYRLNESIIDRIRVYQVAVGLGIAQELTSSGEGNWLFSCTVSNLSVRRYSLRGLDLRSYRTGSTGSVFDNIYLQNFDASGSRPESALSAVEALAHDSLVLRQLNVEHSTFTSHAVVLNQVRNAVVDSLHYEGVEPESWGVSLLSLYDPSSRASIRGMNVVWSRFARERAARLPLIKVGHDCRLVIDGLQMHDNTVTASEVPLVEAHSGATSGAVTVVNCQMQGVTHHHVGFPVDGVPVVKQVGDHVYARHEGDRVVTFGTAAPTKGAWRVGDRRMHSRPTATSPTGWMCVADGAPGKWRAI